jgi:putative transposase
LLARTFGCARYVYNWALHLRSVAYTERQERLNYQDASAALTQVKQQPETAWLSEVSSVPLQQALRHLDTAFRTFFAKHARYPRFKKKRGKQSATYASSAFRYETQTATRAQTPTQTPTLTLAKMEEPLDIHWSRPLPEGATPTTVTISRDTAGRYFVSLLVEVDIAPFPAVDAQVGIDLGLHDVVVLDSGEKVGNPHFFRQEEKRLAKVQRRLAKKQRGSRNRDKGRRRVARIHARIADRRTDFLHKLSTRIIRENQTICIESLRVKAMVKHPTLAKAIHDVGWGNLSASWCTKPPGMDVPLSRLISGNRAVSDARPAGMSSKRCRSTSGRGRVRTWSAGRSMTGTSMPRRIFGRGAHGGSLWRDGKTITGFDSRWRGSVKQESPGVSRGESSINPEDGGPGVKYALVVRIAKTYDDQTQIVMPQ